MEFGTQSKHSSNKDPNADMEQLIKKFRTQPTKILKHRPQYKYGTWIREAWNSKQKLFPNKDPSTDMEQAFKKKFGTQSPKTRTQYRYGTMIQEVWNTVKTFIKQPPQYKNRTGILEVWNIQQNSQTRTTVQIQFITQKWFPDIHGTGIQEVWNTAKTFPKQGPQYRFGINQ